MHLHRFDKGIFAPDFCQGSSTDNVIKVSVGVGDMKTYQRVILKDIRRWNDNVKTIIGIVIKVYNMCISNWP